MDLLRAAAHDRAMPPPPPRLALVGDRSPEVRAHARIPALVAACCDEGNEPIEPYWLASSDVAAEEDVTGFDGIWVVPGSPYRSSAGVLSAIGAARRNGIPLFGTCGGFQYLLVEYARNVCGLGAAAHAEEDPDAEAPLIAPLSCSLRGEEASVLVAPETRAAALLGAGASTERFFCSYGLAPDYGATLAAHGLVISAADNAGSARIVELPGHPFYLATLFQPELSSDPSWVHPLIVGFLDAVRTHAATGTEVAAVLP